MVNGGGYGGSDAYEFSQYGDRSYIDVGSVLADPATYGGVNGESTITAWIKPKDLNRFNAIVRFMGGVHYFSSGTDSSGKLITMVRDVINNINYFPRSLSVLNEDEWVHVAFVFEGGQGYEFYINGVLDRDITEPNIGFHNYYTTSFIGGGAGESFDGLIDEVRLYNRALSGPEIAALAV